MQCIALKTYTYCIFTILIDLTIEDYSRNRFLEKRLFINALYFHKAKIVK